MARAGSIVEAGPPPAPPDLYRRLLLLTGVRLLVGTALLLATAWLTLSGEESFGRRVDVLLYATIGSIYFASLVAVVFLRSGRHLRAVAYAQIAGDVLSASGLVYLTGGADSIFTILYPLSIVNAAISLSRRGAMVGAAIASTAFCTLAMLMERGVLRAPAAFLERAPLPSGQLLLTLGANVSAFFLAAGLSAHLADALQGARKELAKREIQLTALSELHESIVHSITSGLLTIDGARRITFLNRAGQEILGVRTAEIAGQPLAARFPDFADALGRTQPGRGEARLRQETGAIRHLGYSVAPMVDSATPASPGYVIVFQDLTPFRELEEAMRRNDRLAAVGKLAAGLAHEIRNPLASMCGSIELLGHAPGLAAKDRRLMEIVLREGERLEALVRDFLGFARPQEPQLTAVDLGAQLDEALAIFRGEVSARGLKLGGRIEPGILVRADPAQLKQVIWNLLSNAADATAAGGMVSVRLFRAAGGAVLEVEDTGTGISTDDLPHIFDPFFTTKEKGTGLGLALVHRIIERHGGRIEVQSEAGSGTTFRIELAAEVPGAGAGSNRTLGAGA